MKKLFETIINEVERPRMPDARRFVDAHKVAVASDGHEAEGNKNRDASSGVKKDSTRRADPAPGEAEAAYKKLQPDDNSAKAIAARARLHRESSQQEEEVYHGGLRLEGAMAHGILDKDPAKAKDARKKLKELLRKPLPATVAADKIYPLFFADDLFDELDFAERDGSKDVRPVVQSFLKKYRISLSEGFVPSEFVAPTTVLEYVSAVDACPYNNRSQRFDQVTSYRNAVSNVLSDMILARRSLSALHSSLCWQIGRTDTGAAACEALETIVTDHNALLQDLLVFEEEHCSQDFIKNVRAELGIHELDIEDILDREDEGEDE